MAENRKNIEVEKRRYIRLRSFFPVDVYVLDREEKEIEGLYYQGLSRDISLGGLMLEVSHLDPELLKNLLKKEYQLLIKMDIPPHDETHPAIAEVTWVGRDDTKDKFFLGLRYSKIEPAVRNALFFNARLNIWKKRAFAAVIFFLAFFALYAFYSNKTLRKKTFELQQKNVVLAEDRSFFTNKINALIRKEEKLASQLADSEEKIEKLSRMYEEVSADEDLKKEIQNLKKEQEDLKIRLTAIQKGKKEAKKQIRKIRDIQVDTKTVESLLGWMRTKQTNKFGLVPSFSGGTEHSVAYTYDQALAVIAFSLCGDDDRAKRILDFYRKFAQKNEKDIFYNAYFPSGPPSEYLVHVGPNTWIGIAAVQYFLITGDPEYLPMARGIAKWLKTFMDEEGGLKGGPGITWYSTEHNLDVYAFFDMLYYVTQIDEYLSLKEKSFGWIVEHAYDSEQKRFKRGKGDSTIATDTFSWGIAAIGPEVLVKHAMDPFSIIEYAEKNCLTTVSYRNRHDQVIEVTGFDFAKSRHIGRGGVISTEWTSQMIMAYNIMARFTQQSGNVKQAGRFWDKYQFYLNELQKMLIVSTSKTGVSHLCLPYASQPKADTGHGWRTPGGQKTESLSGTCYYLFSQKAFNPISYQRNQAYYKFKPTGKLSRL